MLLHSSFKHLMILTLIGGLMFATAARFPSRSVSAAPASGTLTVNSTADTNTSDSVLTLREALLIARGGTGTGGVNRALTTGEKAQLSGCQFSGTTIIGGINYDNFINYNHHTGIYVAGGSHGNIIGSNTVRNSDDYGVLFDGGNTAYNTITRTAIYSNGLDGIGERNGAGFNVWTEVSISNNGGLGIDKSASNDAQNIVNAPNNFGIDSINRVTGVVHGHADASVLGTIKIELYRVSPDPSGFGEGGVFLGTTTTDVNGNWTITDTSPSAVRGCYTAFVTESQFVIPFSSSEFSANTCRVFLPATRR